jgi:uncharacterized protein YndB with AHSA1/START domain
MTVDTLTPATMTDLPHRLDRELTINASRDIVFRFFTDSERWAKWWGQGSSVDARPGGRVVIRYPGNVVALGEVVEVAAPERLVFTYGYESGKPIGPGASRVVIRLVPEGRATRLTLTHDFAEPSVRDAHRQGWAYQLALFGNVVTDEVNAGAAAVVDDWFRAWSEPDSDRCHDSLARVAVTDVQFRDRVGASSGLDDLVAHIGAAQKHMPGIRLERRGDVRHCQGTVLVDWVALGNDGRTWGQGSNVFTMAADGRIQGVVGFWSQTPVGV